MFEPHDLYPPGPSAVPADLTAPTSAYRRSAWLAFAGLVGFVLLYLALTAYFGWLVYRLVRDSTMGGAGVMGLLLAIPPLLFFLFLVRGLFVVKAKDDPTLLELREEDEPALFAFVRRIADDTGAPRPHRVFLSARVNAAVFYDLSFRNLLFPSKKNLEIGLGLVNALTLDELKAVIAHEFGHFAQRTMAIGRWVYTAQQIAGHIIAARGWLDKMLAFVSGIDLRIAWIGWIMRLFVWAIRAVLDTAFRVIILADRALTREMELQADLVSVSVSGSDSLIHALHRIGPADDAWDRALGFAAAAAGRKKPLADLFAVQERVLERLRQVLGDDALGQTPARPESGREAHRVFEEELAQPPRMWSTHPPNGEREDNAKRRYLASELDPRSAWALFRDPDAVRKTVTQRFAEAAFGAVEGEPVPIEESLSAVDEDYARPSLDRRYRGVYLGRSIVAGVAEVKDLYDPIVDEEPAAILARLDALYPESLTEELERANDLKREQVMLTALQDGILSAPGGVIRYRGEEIPRARLAEVIDRVRAEHQHAETAVLAHDRACRSAHRIAARHFSPAWERYLVSLLELLHYADHASANVRDATDHMHHVLGIVLADGHVSGGERARLLSECQDVWTAMSCAFDQRDQVELPEVVLQKLLLNRVASDEPEIEGWSDFFGGTFDLNPPNEQNLGDWLGVVDSWAYGTADTLGALANATLEALLEAEAKLEAALREGSDPGLPPARGSAPAQYTTLVLGQERERQKKLGWWDRFQLADGFVPGAARLTVAAGLLVPAMIFTGATADDASVTIYNGLNIPVAVAIHDESVTVPARGVTSLDVTTDAHALLVTTTTTGQEIERFEVDVDDAWSEYVYNVAGASPLVEWDATYGTAVARPERQLGTPRWLVTEAETIFEEPPTSVSLPRGSSGTTQQVLTGLADAPPGMQVAFVTDPAARAALVHAHVRWDGSADAALGGWLRIAMNDQEALASLVRARLEEEPDSVLWRRFEQDTAGEARAEVCAQHRERAAAAPDDPDWVYLAARCLESDASAAAVLDAHARSPQHDWLAMAAGYAHAFAGRWDEALPLLESSRTGEVAPLFGGIAVEVARVRRARSDRPEEVSLTDLREVSIPLSNLLLFDGVGLPPNDAELELLVRPWRSLARGELQTAWSQQSAMPDQSGTPSLLRLIAASEGAPPELVERAWGLASDQGIDGTTVWSTMALAVREGRDPLPFITQARELAPEHAEPLIALLDGRLSADPIAAMSTAATNLPPGLRGQAEVMGIILLGDAAPAEWRHEAHALLFGRERPYFR